jgi:uncharacterized protein YijF (DUF1287 family)
MDVIKGKGKEQSEDEKEQERRHKAAAIIQRAYRHHSSKRRHLSSEARWKDTLTGARKQVSVTITYDTAYRVVFIPYFEI